MCSLESGSILCELYFEVPVTRGVGNRQEVVNVNSPCTNLIPVTDVHFPYTGSYRSAISRADSTSGGSSISKLIPFRDPLNGASLQPGIFGR